MRPADKEIFRLPEFVEGVKAGLVDYHAGRVTSWDEMREGIKEMAGATLTHVGLFDKFKVTRLVGREKPDAEYFVLDVKNDPMARYAMRAYANAARQGYVDGLVVNELADDIEAGLARVGDGGTFYPKIPLPEGAPGGRATQD